METHGTIPMWRAFPSTHGRLVPQHLMTNSAQAVLLLNNRNVKHC